MAVYCRECRCVFSRGHINCPFCGSPPQTDSRTVQELVDSGYRLVAAKHRSGGGTAPGLEVQPPNEGSEALERLRHAYRIEDGRTQVHAAPSGGGTDMPRASRPGGERDSLHDWLYGGASPEPAHASYRTAPPEPPPQPPASPPDASGGQRPTFEERELRRLRRSQRIYCFRSRVSSLFHSISLWPWRWVFRILLAAAVILLVRAFVAALPAIFDGVLNLILGLLPIILVIAFLVWLLRSIFRP